MGKYLSLSGLSNFLDNIRNEINRKIFEFKYNLIASQTIITKKLDGTIEGIVEENELGTATTVFAETNGVKSITTVVTPNSGKWEYIKTTTITSDSSSTIFTESYTKTEK